MKKYISITKTADENLQIGVWRIIPRYSKYSLEYSSSFPVVTSCHQFLCLCVPTFLSYLPFSSNFSFLLILVSRKPRRYVRVLNSVLLVITSPYF